MWQRLCAWLSGSWPSSAQSFRCFSTNIFVLLAVLLAVQVGVGILGASVERDAIGDVVNVYLPWADALRPNAKWLGLGLPWVYPFVAWAPILAAKACSLLTI